MKIAEQLTQTINKFTIKDSKEIKEMEDFVKNFNQLVDNGLATHRGYRLFSVDKPSYDCQVPVNIQQPCNCVPEIG